MGESKKPPRSSRKRRLVVIVVGVALDTLQQIESHLVMRHYDGFMTKGRLRARR